MAKKNILLVLLQLDAGGSERVALDLARSFDKEKFEVYLAAFKGGVLEPAFREVCKEIFFIEKKLGFDPGAMLRLSRIIARHRIDVVNAHHYMPCLYSFLGSRVLHARKLIYTEHSVPEVEGIRASIHGTLLNWMLYKINAVVGVSCQITDTFKRCYPRHTENFVTILNGVNVEKFYQPQFRDTIRKQFGFKLEHFVVGTVANFRKIKNHACIVRAAVRLKDTCPRIRFLFIGTGFPGDAENSEKEVRQMIKDFGLEESVIFAGYQDNIPAVLSSFDAFCLPSFSEGLPVGILEAMAAKVPVLGSNVTGIREVIDNGKTGLLFANNDDEALACLLRGLVTKSLPAENMVHEAHRFVGEYHACGIFTDSYSSIFSETLQSSKF